MAIFRPSELRTYLEGLGISPTKALSQNFLIDGNILQKITTLANVQPGDLVLEIGPGPGALTEQLLAAGAEVIAVEKDRVLADGLKRIESDRLHIECADILEFPISEAIGDRRAKVIANLPYNITTPILERLLPMHQQIESLTVMVQEEVGRRMTAPPGNRIYGSLSVFLRFFGTPTYGFRVKAGCFFPPPKVESAVIQIALQPPPPVNEKRFFLISRTAFGQRRKMLRGSLKGILSVEQMESVGISPEARPEELGLEQWIRLAQIHSDPS